MMVKGLGKSSFDEDWYRYWEKGGAIFCFYAHSQLVRLGLKFGDGGKHHAAAPAAAERVLTPALTFPLFIVLLSLGLHS